MRPKRPHVDSGITWDEYWTQKLLWEQVVLETKGLLIEKCAHQKFHKETCRLIAKKRLTCPEGFCPWHSNGNRVEITALLNLYHEIRGSEYRHNIRIGDEWWYDASMTSLRKELNIARLDP